MTYSHVNALAKHTPIHLFFPNTPTQTIIKPFLLEINIILGTMVLVSILQQI